MDQPVGVANSAKPKPVSAGLNFCLPSERVPSGMPLIVLELYKWMACR
jgi:hypothetical protein